MKDTTPPFPSYICCLNLIEFREPDLKLYGNKSTIYLLVSMGGATPSYQNSDETSAQ